MKVLWGKSVMPHGGSVALVGPYAVANTYWDITRPRGDKYSW